MKKEYLYTIFMMIFLFLQISFYGVSDFMAFLLLIMALMRAASASDEASRHNIEKLTRKEDDNGVI